METFLIFVTVGIGWASMHVIYRMAYSRGRFRLADEIVQGRVEIVPEYSREDDCLYGIIKEK